MKLLVTITAICTTFIVWTQNWVQLDDFPGTQRDDGCSFETDAFKYCGTGRDAGFQVTNDFYTYVPFSESWVQVASLPGAARQYATATGFSGGGYLFGGIDGQGNFLNDLWVYNWQPDQWTFLGNAPFEGRSGAQCFIVDLVLYIVGGRTISSNATNEVWGFDLVTETWQSYASVPNDGIWRGFGTSYNDIGIVGMGSDSTSRKRGEIYFYDPAIDFWIEMTQIETEPMNYPATSLKGDRFFVYGGEDTLGVYRNDFRYLDLINLTWNSLAPFTQEGRRGAMAFSSESDFYITTGLTSTQRLSETWVARDVVGINEPTVAKDLAMYVLDGNLILPNQSDNCQLFSSTGQLINLTMLEPGVFRLPKSLPKGVYYCSVMDKGNVLTGKLVVH